MENAAHTFELLLFKAVEENPENAAAATEKTKHRVLKVKKMNFDLMISRTCGHLDSFQLCLVSNCFGLHLAVLMVQIPKRLAHSGDARYDFWYL